jgi:glycosyltransferase involved in cell wall biosynthesis
MTLGFLRGQVAFMKSRGFIVSAVSSPGEDLDRFGREEGISVHAVKMERRITPLRDLAAVLRLWWLLRRIQPQIVHAHTPKGGLLGMIAAFLARVPVRVYHLRGLPLLTARGLRRIVLTLAERISCCLAHSVLCNSNSLRGEAVRAKLCNPRKLEVLLCGSGNGVDAQVEFNPQALGAATRDRVRAELDINRDALVLGFIGRVVRDKGIAELVEAWETLRHEFPDLWLLIVGPCESEDPVPRSTLEALRIDPRVRIRDYETQTSPFYAAMDLVVLPTYREGFPNVLLEAAAMELPVVASRVTGCVDAVRDGETGMLVPPRDSAALAKALRCYIERPELRRQHGEAARSRVLRDFDPKALWEEVEHVYRSLLCSPRTTS